MISMKHRAFTEPLKSTVPVRSTKKSGSGWFSRRRIAIRKRRDLGCSSRSSALMPLAICSCGSASSSNFLGETWACSKETKLKSFDHW